MEAVERARCLALLDELRRRGAPKGAMAGMLAWLDGTRLEQSGSWSGHHWAPHQRAPERGGGQELRCTRCAVGYNEADHSPCGG